MNETWKSSLPPRPTNFNRYLPEGYRITDEWGDDWILTDGKFVVEGWYIREHVAALSSGKGEAMNGRR